MCIWHVVPLPRGTPYEAQQLELYKHGVLDMPEADRAALRSRIRDELRST